MGLLDDLKQETKSIFAVQWQERLGKKVPESEDLRLGNDAVIIDATVLYADLAESTKLVDKRKPHFAAEIYKSYLHCASKIIRKKGGIITSFDGDRVMGVFFGDIKNTSAVKCALGINHAVNEIINPMIRNQYPNCTYKVTHGVGIDNSKLFVARTGIRGSNDLVWVGRAANYAARLCSLRSLGYSSFITSQVYEKIHKSAKLSSDGRNMWLRTRWAEKNLTIYGSNWFKGIN